MESIVPYAIWICIILIGLGLLALVGFGLRSLSYGKVSPLSIAMIVIPFVILGGLGVATGDWVLAAIWTAVIMFLAGLVALFISGARSLVGF